MPHDPSVPAFWFRAIIHGLNGQELAGNARAHVDDLARFWAMPELFEDRVHTAEPPRASGYHEIHCHLRGGVPYIHLWQGWLSNERWRASLRRHPCSTGSWSMTWAELVCEAAALQRELRPGVTDARHAIPLFVAQLSSADEREVIRAVKYLSICNSLRRFLVHQRGRAGLSSFVNSYERYSKVQKVRGSPASNQEQHLVVALLERFEQDGAVAVEIRPTLDRRRHDLQRKLTDIVLGYFHYLGRATGRSPVLMGIVPSIFKQEILPRSRDPQDPRLWEVQSDVWCNQVRTLLAILDDVPALRWFVVGLDAAGKERGCPPRALRDAFGLVRRYNESHGVSAARAGRRMHIDWLRGLLPDGPGDDARRVSAALDQLNRAHVTPIRLGITVHAGEDFEEPLTGLRHIWETLSEIDLGEGDRVGHALAAGLRHDEVRSLLERRTRAADGEVERLGSGGFRVRKPRGTHLLDLAWAWRVLDGQRERRTITEQLAHAAMGAFGTPTDAERLARALLTPGTSVRPALPSVRFGDPTHVAPEDRIWVTLDEAWFALFEDLRLHVLRELGRRRVIVESCPSSNLAVANLDVPPFHELARHLGARCVVATDDPGLLSAWPADEIARVNEAQSQSCIERTALASFVTAAPR